MSPADGAILAIDTATSAVVVALGRSDGTPVAVTSWPAGHRHGEQLLPSVERLLAEVGVARGELRAIVVGTGPGAFTGLRVGLATAKALAHGIGCPIAGVATSEALIAAAGAPEHVVLLLPAGPSDRVIARAGQTARLLPGGTEPDLGPDDVLVAVDLAGRAPDAALARGERAREGLARELLRRGAGRLPDGGDDLASLVPEYVTLPRGVAAPVAEGVSWSHGPR
jgi:tRNA threonylcarbamoyl adenosine modification protein YeaZ